MIKGMSHAVFSVLDQESAKELYTEKLGFEEPAERPYGIEGVSRDGLGNWFSLTQRAERSGP